MSDYKQSWPAEEVDAIRLSTLGGQLKIEASEGKEVEFESERASGLGRGRQIEPSGRWLSLGLWNHHGGDATLRLPKAKPWVIEVWSPRGRVEASGIQARLSVNLGKGDVQVQGCRGRFSFSVGKGTVKVENCEEAEMPERPPVPEGERQFAGGPLPPMPEGPGVVFGFRRGPKVQFGMGAPGEPSDWEDWDAEEWSRWGEEIGERAAAWAEGFVSQFFEGLPANSGKYGLQAKIGHGDADLQDVTAQTCGLRLGSGDLQVKRGQIAKLSVKVGHGEVEIERVKPQGEWAIGVQHGDVKLAFPPEARARLDVATRHGDIDSEISLVRVGRPGRESRHGGRMVGTVGPADATAAEVGVTTLHGDIEIRGPRGERAPVSRSAEPAATASRAPSAAAQTSDASPQASDKPPASPAAEDRPAATGYTSQMAILQALAEGHISVSEAEQLLRGLER